MPDFIAHTLDLALCRSEVDALRALLQGSTNLGEATLRELFRTRSDISLRALGNNEPNGTLTAPS